MLLLVNYQQASTMNIQSTRGSGAVVNQFEELAQQGFILYVVLHWSANNNVDYNIVQYYTRWLIIA